MRSGEPMLAFRHAPSFNGTTTREAVQKALDEGAAASAIVAELSKLIPIGETVAALENGRTMVDWFKANLRDPGIHDDGSVVGAFMTVAVDDEMNVVFMQDFDADWNKVEQAMRAVFDRMTQQFRDRGLCPFAPIEVPKA